MGSENSVAREAVSVPPELARCRDLVRVHEAWRSKTLNMIASENALSPAVRAALNNDWLGRYSDYTGRDLTARRYRGTKYIVELEQLVEAQAKDLFRAEFIELRPLGGHLAGGAVIAGLCKPGDTVLELGPDGGSHRQAKKFSMPALLPLDVHFLPFDGTRFNIDLVGAERLIEESRPRLVILGSSTFLFPHPVREIKAILRRVNPEGILVFDGSHVMGFLASGRFQDPLGEGADIVFGSIHKTFPGPQGGIIFTNREDLILPASEAIYPAFVTNHHAFRMPALSVALAEMDAFGPAYTDQIIANSQTLGEQLEALGLPCVKVDGCYSKSHTVLMRIETIGNGEELAGILESCDIIATPCSLPKEQGGQGIRLGTQELTRLGAKELEIKQAAQLIAAAIRGRESPEAVAERVHELTARLGPVHFGYQ